MKRKYLLLAAAFLLSWLASANPVQISSWGNNIQVSFTLGQWQLGTETVKWSNRMMQAFNLMGDPSFVIDGILTKPTNIVFNGDYNLVNGISAVFEATDTIEISGNFVVENGASLILKAGGEVILGNGFKVEEGGELCIIVE